ncbi:MAG: transporter substrate-binding domain-containing protein [Candidatus Eremiobacteraeota bacterium]|nr:transporter substrate-binding domain-containing protein [Candidatus Eremiobacteraeota bacterium]
MFSRTRAVSAIVALGAAVALLAPQPVVAEDTMAAIKARGKMIVGVKADYPPFGFLDNGKNVGIEIDLLHMIAKDMLGNADAIEFVPVVSANRFQYLNTNKVDFLMSTVTITAARKQVIDFSQPYMKSGWGIMVKRSAQGINDAQDLGGKTVVVVPGSTGEAALKTQVPTANLLRLPQTSEGLQAVSQGRADAFVQDAALLYGLERSNPGFKVVGQSHDDGDVLIGAACRKGDSAPCDFITKEVVKWTKNGVLKKTYHKWLYGAESRFMP